MKIYKHMLIILLVCFISTSFILARQNPSSQSSQNTFPILRKKADILTKAQRETSSITLRFDEMQPGDLININPEGSQLEASGGIVAKGLERAMSVKAILPDNSLSLTSTSLLFTRPLLNHETIFLDVKVPAKMNIQIILKGKTILNTQLSKPIAISDGQLKEGSKTLAATVMNAISLTPTNSVQPLGTNLYFVPLSQLQLIYQPTQNLHSVKNLNISLEINEEGEVTNVKSLTNEPLSVDIDSIFKAWKFKPYLVKNKPAKIVTVFSSNP